MPDVVSLVLHADAGGLWSTARLIEEAEVDPFCMFTEESEVDATPIPRSPKGVRLPRKGAMLQEMLQAAASAGT